MFHRKCKKKGKLIWKTIPKSNKQEAVIPSNCYSSTFNNTFLAGVDSWRSMRFNIQTNDRLPMLFWRGREREREGERLKRVWPLFREKVPKPAHRDHLQFHFSNNNSKVVQS